MQIDKKTVITFNPSRLTVFTPRGEGPARGSELKIKYSDFPEIREMAINFVELMAQRCSLTHLGSLCARCGSCCRRENILVKGNDVFRLSRRLGITPEKFLKRHVKSINTWNPYDGVLKLRRGKCPFLKQKPSRRYFCSVYEDRPAGCRNYAPNSPTCKKDLPYLIEELDQIKVCGNRADIATSSSTSAITIIEGPEMQALETLQQKLSGFDGEMVNLVDQATDKALDVLTRFRKNQAAEMEKKDYRKKLADLRQIVENLAGMTNIGWGENSPVNRLWSLLHQVETNRSDSGETKAETIEDALFEEEDIEIRSISLQPTTMVINIANQFGFIPCPYPLNTSTPVMQAVRHLLREVTTIDDDSTRQVVAGVAPPCYLCGECCRAYSVEITPSDITRLSDHLKMSEQDFREKHLDPNRFSWNRGNGILKKKLIEGEPQESCHLMEKRDDGYYYCTVHQVKPEVCRNYTTFNKLCRSFNHEKYWYCLIDNVLMVEITPRTLTLVTKEYRSQPVPRTQDHLARLGTFGLKGKGLDRGGPGGFDSAGAGRPQPSER